VEQQVRIVGSLQFTVEDEVGKTSSGVDAHTSIELLVGVGCGVDGHGGSVRGGLSLDQL
jgi:hypothetical protein